MPCATGNTQALLGQQIVRVLCLLCVCVFRFFLFAILVVFSTSALCCSRYVYGRVSLLSVVSSASPPPSSSYVQLQFMAIRTITTKVKYFISILWSVTCARRIKDNWH